MTNLLNGGPIVVLYSDRADLYSHCIRLTLAEKDVETDIRYVDEGAVPERLAEVNPYATTPTLVDRELALYDTQIILEYLDERFPHPPLMPVDPMSKAMNRQLRYRIARDLYEPALALDGDNEIAAASARKNLRARLTELEPVFANMPYFMSEEFTLVDCCIAPLLWRLDAFNIKLPTDARGLRKYMRSLFKRTAFRASLTDPERAMRQSPKI